MVKKSDIRYIYFPSTGSAARVAEVVETRKKKATLPKPKAQTTVLHIGPLALVGLVMCVVMVALMAVGLNTLQQLRDEQDVLEGYVDQLTMENGRLRRDFNENCKLDEVYNLAVGMGMVPMESVQHMNMTLNPAPSYQVSEERGHTWLTDLFG